MKNHALLTLLCMAAAVPTTGSAQQYRSDYVDWGPRGQEFCHRIADWQPGQKWSADDNFFISRVKPRARFRNEASQINPDLTAENDKNLIFWVPINNENSNAMPDGVFDSEVFPMWSYVTHYGNWSTSLCRIPGNFLDVAHRNGVPVSPVAGVPWGNISDQWSAALDALAASKEGVGDYLEYYGIDGLGYNSEFNGKGSTVSGLRDLHAYLVERFKTSGSNPLFENIWYDGTNDAGSLQFDNGLGAHNDDNWGYGESERSVLFFNYNWNAGDLLARSVAHARSLGRTPLDLYAGFNMQGREPKSGTRWPLLAQYPVSIGLWGAHSKNMFFEGRGEKGSHPDARQRSYMLRVERWFTGGRRNPADCPEISNSLKCNVDNEEFFGMSSLMSARSPLKWDLADEPFFSSFNLGNGKFFNWKGRRCNDNEWYNIGVQDYLPTWRWWWSGEFLGREPQKANTGLDAEFTWDDAWTGGSCVRVYGNSAKAYLHLFKTEYALQPGDVVSFTYKTRAGEADLSLALSAKGAESSEVTLPMGRACGPGQEQATGHWQTVTATVGSDFELNGDLAVIALRVDNASGLDLLLGELSISRPTGKYACTKVPEVESTTLLAHNRHGADGKIIFNIPNDVPEGQVCYNSDIDASMFMLYFQQEGCEPVAMGLTSSWAGLVYAAPVSVSNSQRIRFGVAVVSEDRTVGDPVWGEWHETGALYEESDDITVDKCVINPGEEFNIRYLDPRHSPADWELRDATGNVMLHAERTTGMHAPSGLPASGLYDLVVTCSGQQTLLRGFIAVNDPSAGSIPEITSIKVNGREESTVKIQPGDYVDIEYTGRPATGEVSRGLRITTGGVGFKYKDSGLADKDDFSVSFWFRPDEFTASGTHLLNIRDKGDAWAKNTWGWFYHVLNEDGSFNSFTLSGNEYATSFFFDDDVRLHPGVWTHLTYVFERTSRGSVRPTFYINGERKPIRYYVRNGKTIEKDFPYIPDCYNWRKENVVAVGGYLHNGGSVRGCVDDLMLWDGPLTEETVAQAMATPAQADMPESLVACWDFENEPEAEGCFLSRGRTAFHAGMHDYADTETEGQGVLLWQQPVLAPGSPYSAGRAFTLETHPEVEVADAVVHECSGDDLAGRIRLWFPEGDKYYPVRLNLVNGLGESRPRTIHVHAGETSVESVIEPASAIRLISASTGRIEVEVDAPGEYMVAVTALDGRCALHRAFRTTSAGRISLAADLLPGIAVVTLTAPDAKPQVVKLTVR